MSDEPDNGTEQSLHSPRLLSHRLKNIEGTVVRLKELFEAHIYGAGGNPGLATRVDRLEIALSDIRLNSNRIDKLEDQFRELRHEDVAILKRSEAERAKRMDRLQAMVYSVAGTLMVAMILGAAAYFTK